MFFLLVAIMLVCFYLRLCAIITTSSRDDKKRSDSPLRYDANEFENVDVYDLLSLPYPPSPSVISEVDDKLQMFRLHFPTVVRCT